MTNRIATYSQPTPPTLVTSKWAPPLEGFTPHPQYTRPLVGGSQNKLDSLLNEAKSHLQTSELILAHETTPESAQRILSDGFTTDKQGSSAIRDNAVFGWIHTTDIGHYQQTEREDSTHVVLFSVPRQRVFVSSYKTSAKQLMLGDLSSSEYDEKHVLVYDDYERLYWTQPFAVQHLGYRSDSLLPSR